MMNITRHSTIHSRHWRGFTLIEMLIVISIIVILMALLIPVLGTVQQRAKIRATRAMLDGIQNALQRYYIDFNEYPPSNTTGISGLVDDSSLYVYLSGPNGRGIDTVQGGLARHRDPYMNIPPEYIKRVSGKTLIVDPWGSTIVYLNCKAHADLGGVTAGKCHNKTFDLYSVGPDKMLSPNQHDFADSNGNGRVDEDAEGGDDITNWTMGVDP
jgi:prepilin-type N-terminal cleavage/methylation domain-containing protein